MTLGPKAIGTALRSLRCRHSFHGHRAHPPLPPLSVQATLGRLGLSAPDLAGLASGQLVSGESLAGDWGGWEGGRDGCIACGWRSQGEARMGLRRCGAAAQPCHTSSLPSSNLATGLTPLPSQPCSAAVRWRETRKPPQKSQRPQGPHQDLATRQVHGMGGRRSKRHDALDQARLGLRVAFVALVHMAYRQPLFWGLPARARMHVLSVCLPAAPVTAADPQRLCCVCPTGARPPGPPAPPPPLAAAAGGPPRRVCRHVGRALGGAGARAAGGRGAGVSLEGKGSDWAPCCRCWLVCGMIVSLGDQQNPCMFSL